MMKRLLTIFFSFANVFHTQAQDTTIACKKNYASVANYCIMRDSMQQKQDWNASIVINQINESDPEPATTAKSYRLSVSYAQIGDLDSAFRYLNIFLDNPIADYMVIIDPLLKTLKEDTTRWKTVKARVEQGYLACLDNSVNKEYALLLFYLGVEDQKYRYYYPILQLDYDGDCNGLDDYRHDTVFDLLVKKYGFPTISLVGTHAAQAGFGIIQHTTFSKNYRNRYKAVVKAFKENDYDPQCYARVKDRWLLRHHRKQLYGTNWLKSTSKKFVKRYGNCYILEPVRNFTKLDERRAALGMETIRDYMKNFPEYKIPEKYYRKKMRKNNK